MEMASEDLTYTPELRSAFKVLLLDLLKNDLEVAAVICSRAKDVYDAKQGEKK